MPEEIKIKPSKGKLEVDPSTGNTLLKKNTTKTHTIPEQMKYPFFNITAQKILMEITFIKLFMSGCGIILKVKVEQNTKGIKLRFNVSQNEAQYC